MAQVISEDKTAMKRITHKACATVIEYAEGEVRELWRGTDYSGGADGANGFTCPKCGKDVITERW